MGAAGHFGEPVPVRFEPQQNLLEAGQRKLGLLDDFRRLPGREPARVEQLLPVLVVRIGHENGRQAADGDLRHRARPGAAQHQIGPGVGVAHFADEAHQAVIAVQVHFELLVALPGSGHGGEAALVQHLQRLSAAPAGDQVGNQRIEGVGALAAAKHEQAQRPFLAAPAAVGDPEDFPAHRIAGEQYPPLARKSLGKGFINPRRPAADDPVGEPGNRVLFVDQHRDAQQAPGDRGRAGDIAAHADQAIGPQLAQNPHCAPSRAQQHERRLQQPARAGAAQARHADGVEREGLVAQQFVFHPRRGAEPMNADTRPLQLPGDAERGKDMAAGAGRQNQHGWRAPAHGRLRRRSARSADRHSVSYWTRSSRPIIAQQTIRLAPP